MRDLKIQQQQQLRNSIDEAEAVTNVHHNLYDSGSCYDSMVTMPAAGKPLYAKTIKAEDADAD
jgi:hypothetical protein